MHRNNKWLIISYFSKVDGMACSQHIDNRIPCLEKHGIEPLMLTSICGDNWSKVYHEKVLSVSPSGLRFELRHLRNNGKLNSFIASILILLILPFYLLEKIVIDLDSEWSWFPLAFLAGSRIIKKEQPEVIYSTGGPASAHLAAALLSKRFKIPWVAELQDPIVHEDWQRSKRALKVYKWLEQLICTRADAVIFLTAKALSNAAERTGLNTKGHFIYPGASPIKDKAIRATKGTVCNFAHFGSLGGSRNLKVFLEALQHVLEFNPKLAEVIRLDLYGNCDKLSKQLILNFPWKDVICDHGRVSHDTSIAAMHNCSVLLLIQNTEIFSSETIPSKVYEYFQSGRPVLGLIYHNEELKKMFEELGHISAEADNPVDVARAIMISFTYWNENKIGTSIRSKYTVSHAVKKIISLEPDLA